MSKNERLLRIASLIIILRDEVEDAGTHPDWCEVANEYLEQLTGENSKVHREYDRLMMHVYNVVLEMAQPCDLIPEMFAILKKDLQRLNVTHPINAATQEVNVVFSVDKVKVLDSKIVIR